jgi:hypothetical protein
VGNFEGRRGTKGKSMRKFRNELGGALGDFFGIKKYRQIGGCLKQIPNAFLGFLKEHFLVQISRATRGHISRW